MKNNCVFLLLGLALVFYGCQTKSKENSTSNFPLPEDLYFGETPPGLIPKLFDPQIISPEGLFEGGSFSPDMREFYFTRKNGKYKERSFFVIRYENGRWGKESETDIKWPQFSEDGNMIYLSLIHI